MEKVCFRCKQRLPLENFNKCKKEKNKDERHSYCKACFTKYVREHRHKQNENTEMSKNTKCSSYLGVYITETLLSKEFKNVERMPYGNKGYDFVCNKGLKIDAKSSCIKNNFTKHYWNFCIKRNKIPDYFVCLAYDNRENLTPLHLWIIPGHVINHLTGLIISETTMDKWKMYEREIKIDGTQP